mgnify:CR=1 FL=1
MQFFIKSSAVHFGESVFVHRCDSRCMFLILLFSFFFFSAYRDAFLCYFPGHHFLVHGTYLLVVMYTYVYSSECICVCMKFLLNEIHGEEMVKFSFSMVSTSTFVRNAERLWEGLI